MTVTICSDILHTSGAALYAFRSWLTFVVFLARHLEPNILVVKLSPKSRIGSFGFGGTFQDILEITSLQDLGHREHFLIDIESSGCNYTNCSSRISDSLNLHNRNFTSDLKFTGNLYEFINDISTYIKNESEVNKNLVISFGVYHWTSGPLAHVSSILKKERELVDRIVEFKHLKPYIYGEYDFSCGYVYIRKPITNDTIVGIDGGAYGHKYRISTYEYVRSLRQIIKNKTNCVRINALGFTYWLEQNLKAFHLSYTIASSKQSVEKDIIERDIALKSDLLITEQGTHQFDWTLSKRVLEEKTSVILTYKDGIVKKIICDKKNNFCLGCNFFRTKCVHKFIPRMETNLCKRFYNCNAKYGALKYRFGQ
jgi:hypothetical protein